MTNPVRSGRSPTRSLPDRPNLEHLRKEAKSRLKRLRETDPTAQLAIAQLEVARQYGFQSWRRLQADVSKPSAIAETETPEERLERLRFDQALPRRAVSIDPSVLERYVGVYELNPKTVMTVQRDGDGLIARLTGQMFFSLDPESTRKFFYRNSVLRAQLSFLVEPDGTVTAAVLHQNGHERTAARVDDDRARIIETLREERQSANTPAPGSEAALRRIIVRTRDGVPDDDLMSDGLATHFKEQLPDNKRLLASWGHLISVSFIGVSKADDSDVYDVVFASALTEWRLTMEGPETIGSASFRVKP